MTFCNTGHEEQASIVLGNRVTMLEKVLKRSHKLKAHPRRSGSYLIVREDIFGIRILGEMVYDKLDHSRQTRKRMKSEGLKVIDIKEYHTSERHIVWQDPLIAQYRYWESPGYYSKRIVAYRPITSCESKTLIKLIKANKEQGIGLGL